MIATTKACPICQKRLPVDEKLLSVDAKSDWEKLHAKCDSCEIGISNSKDPKNSRFIWKTIEKNMISQNKNDLDRLTEIIDHSMNEGNRPRKKIGMKHENSEDALSWNVFSYLEKHDLLNEAYKYFTGLQADITGCQVYYWGYNDKETAFIGRYKDVLKKAGEPKWGGGYTEPDILLYVPKSGLINIEVKYTSSNDDKLKEKNNNERNKRAQQMLDLGKSFVKKDQVVDWTWYELLRMWVPGCLLAKKMNVKFYLINLLPQEMLINEKGAVSNDMHQCIQQSSKYRFAQMTWEAFAYEISTWDNKLEVSFWNYLNRKLKKDFRFIGESHDRV
jgi:hypothetical protein